MLTHLTLVSNNGKTGPMPVSTTSAHSCPDACPLKVKGCYAKGGNLLSHWRKVTNGIRGGVFSEFLKEIKSLSIGQVWRHNQAGDLLGENNKIDVKALKALVLANKGRKGFTYTHKPVLGNSKLEKANRNVVKHANDNGFTINLSGNNLDHADKLAELNIGPVVTILPIEAPNKGVTPQGRRWIACPAEYSNINCANCQLCQKQRDIIVGFHAHGNGAKTASAIARG